MKNMIFTQSGTVRTIAAAHKGCFCAKAAAAAVYPPPKNTTQPMAADIAAAISTAPAEASFARSTYGEYSPRHSRDGRYAREHGAPLPALYTAHHAGNDDIKRRGCVYAHIALG